MTTRISGPICFRGGDFSAAIPKLAAALRLAKGVHVQGPLYPGTSSARSGASDDAGAWRGVRAGRHIPRLSTRGAHQSGPPAKSLILLSGPVQPPAAIAGVSPPRPDQPQPGAIHTFPVASAIL
jgi:hypothetical protein